MNDDGLNEFIQHASDKLLYEILVGIFKREFGEDSVIFTILTLAKQYDMPVKNILPFIKDLGEWCREHQDKERDDLSDLLSRSGFMTIGFCREGDDISGNG